MCNPIAQAELLNRAETQFNICLGLCVGHDSLFYRYSQAPVTHPGGQGPGHRQQPRGRHLLRRQLLQDPSGRGSAVTPSRKIPPAIPWQTGFQLCRKSLFDRLIFLRLDCGYRLSSASAIPLQGAQQLRQDLVLVVLDLVQLPRSAARQPSGQQGRPSGGIWT